MRDPRRPDADERAVHGAITARLLVETWGVLAILASLSLALIGREGPLVDVGLALVITCQGAWLHRLYTAAHEAIHYKLTPARPRLNDLLGQALLVPLLVPLPVYRQIHFFHHGHNRRDPATAALDTFVCDRPPGRLRRAYYRALWYAGVFAGGYFLHGLVSIVLFLCLPQSVARRVSPAFAGWRERDRLSSLPGLLLGAGLHAAVYAGLGADAYLALLGAPTLVFAWIYSLLVYVYHCGASYGPRVRYNVRSLRRAPLLAWWLLNFNEHATHHRDPSIPWHQLPAKRRPLPPEFAANERVATLGAALRNLLRGPRIVVRAREEGA